VYSYILPRSILSQGNLSTREVSRAAMAEPLHSIWWKECVILSAVLRSISLRLSRRNSSLLFDQIIQFKKAALSKLPKFARGIETCVIYMVGDDT
jgi:hypothetical protein